MASGAPIAAGPSVAATRPRIALGRGPTGDAAIGGLPPLRDELILHPGPTERDGAPSWTLEDPARARYFRLGWAEIEMLARWDKGDPASVASSVTEETTLTLTASEVEAFARFLASANLVQLRGARAIDLLEEQARAARMNPLAFVLKNYLFIRIPLVRPDGFLAATRGLAAPFFTRAFWIATVMAGILGLLLALRQWDAFATTFLHLFSWQGLAAIAVALVITKIAHELAHAHAARREGLPVPTMGIALMVLYPVLYTDTTAGWRLTDRRKRLRIGYAGMAIELAIAAWMTLAWSFMPDGAMRSATFVLATTTWIMTLAINLNPFMRFDGYFLFSDLLDMPNLQDRAFKLARWRLREALFGFREPPPERFPAGRARLLIAYAAATWIYRFLLFLGIALIVYHFFFKALGIILMVVELAWFIGRPIALELREWYERRERYRLNRNTIVTLGTCLTLLALFLMPLQWAIHAPAMLRAERQTQIYAPADAMLVGDTAPVGADVAQGDTLFTFAAPDMSHRLDDNARAIALLRWRAAVDAEASGAPVDRAALWRELEGALAERASLTREAGRLTVRAAHAGRVVERDPETGIGDWIGAGEWLATLIVPEARLIEAYLGEADLARVSPGSTATFYPDAPTRHPIPVTITEIADTATARLASAPELASPYGGGIAAHSGEDGPVADSAVYRVLARPDDAADDARTADMTLRGTLRLQGERISLAARSWRAIRAVLIRESGF
ncbi:MAG: HlyD family efflux transporter periplasmic adaptor subunit [Salinarimonas sp.]|nr:HlyD family efflux transporter periplasmic adaptor subunit [Salinarimonas sp.]